MLSGLNAAYAAMDTHFETYRYIHSPDHRVDPGDVLENFHSAQTILKKFVVMREGEMPACAKSYLVFDGYRDYFAHTDVTYGTPVQCASASADADAGASAAAKAIAGASAPHDHEVVFGWQPQRIKFDIDASHDTLMQMRLNGNAQERIYHALNVVIDAILTAFYTTWMRDLSPTDIVYCRSVREGEPKYSYHLVLPYAVADSGEATAFTQCVMSILPTEYHKIVDTGVNKQLQCFRMVGSTKPGSSRVKTVLGGRNREDTVITNTQQLELLPRIRAAGTGDITHCVNAVDSAAESAGAAGSAHSEDVMRAVQLVCEKFGTQHQFRRCVGNLLVFDRLTASYCDLCLREHAKDNTLIAFVWRKCGEVSVHYGCRHDQQRQRVRLGGFVSAMASADTICADCGTAGARADTDAAGAGATASAGATRGVGEAAGARLPYLEYVLRNPSPRPRSLWEGMAARTEYCEPKMRPYEPAHTLCVHAAMKMGKTKALVQYLRRFDNALRPPTIRILSFRQTFSNNLRAAFPDYAVYSDVRGDLTQRKLIVQVESLHRVVCAEPADVVVLDECESIFEQFDSGLLRDFAGSFAVFQWMLRYARVVVAMDAALGDRSYRILERMRPGFAAGAVYHHNTWQPGRDDSYEFTTSRERWLTRVYAAIARGRRVAIPISSLEYARAIATDVARRYPDKRVKLYSSETSQAERREHFADVDAYWSMYDVLVYTPTISAGVSFERRHFDIVAGYFTDMSCPVETCMQMMGRIRDVAGRQYLVYMDAHGDCLPTTVDEITRAYCRQRACLRGDAAAADAKGAGSSAGTVSTSALANPLPTYEFGPNGELRFCRTDYFTIWAENTRVRNVSRNNFVRTFVERVRETGAMMKPMETPADGGAQATAAPAGAADDADNAVDAESAEPAESAESASVSCVPASHTVAPSVFSARATVPVATSPAESAADSAGSASSAAAAEPTDSAGYSNTASSASMAAAAEPVVPTAQQIIASLSAHKTAHNAQTSRAIAAARELTDEEYNDLRAVMAVGDDISDDMRHSMSLYRLRRTYRYGGEITPQFVVSYSRARVARAYRNLVRIYAYDDPIESLEAIRREEFANYLRNTADYADTGVPAQHPQNNAACRARILASADASARYVYDQHRVAVTLMRAVGWQHVYDPQYLSATAVVRNARAAHSTIMRCVDSAREYFGRRRRVRIPALCSANDAEYAEAVTQLAHCALGAMYGAGIRYDKDAQMYRVEPCALFALTPDATARPWIKSA